jgi:hypothetical protein
MTDLLAIVGPSESDDELLEEVSRRRPDRVTVLIEDDADTGQSGRLARLLRAIEQRTGAVIVGFVRDRSQLVGWRFDRVAGRRAAPGLSAAPTPRPAG